MTQEELIEKSQEEVRFLNGGDESAREAYREGYLDCMEDINKLTAGCGNPVEFAEIVYEFLKDWKHLCPFKEEEQ